MVDFIRKNKKKLCICISCILFLIVFALYMKKNLEWSNDKLSAWEEDKVEAAWAEKWNAPNFELNENVYYGTCRGCVILFSGGVLPAVTEITVAGEEFTYGYIFSIWVYKDGVFLELKEAYERGWLIKENIADIAKYHRQRTSGVEKYGDDKPDTHPTVTLVPTPISIVTKIPTMEVDLLKLLENNYWQKIPSSAASPYILQADALSGMIVFGTGETTLVYVTKDAGATWKQMEIPRAGTHHHAKVTCATAISDTTYCVGYRYWGAYDGAFYLTTDSGNTWTRLALEEEIPEDITSNMRYAEAVDVTYLENRLQVQVSCKTKDYSPWSVEIKLESVDMGETWCIVETWEEETDAEID